MGWNSRGKACWGGSQSFIFDSSVLKTVGLEIKRSIDNRSELTLLLTFTYRHVKQLGIFDGRPHNKSIGTDSLKVNNSQYFGAYYLFAVTAWSQWPTDKQTDGFFFSDAFLSLYWSFFQLLCVLKDFFIQFPFQKVLNCVMVWWLTWPI